MNITISAGSINVHLGGVLSYNPNGTVQAGPFGVEVLGYSFGRGGSSTQVINPSGTTPDNVAITTTVPVGTMLQPGDSLVVLFRYEPHTAFSANDEALALVVVPYAVDASMMRPPAMGNPANPLVHWLRTQPIYVPDAMSLAARLPSIISIDSLPVQWGAWATERPSLQAAAAEFAGFCGELWQGWGTYFQTPSTQHPGYGRTLQYKVSQALCLLLSTDPFADKLPLAYSLTQWGIDLVGAFAMGRDDQANGGHMQARKALIIFSGYILDAPWKTPSTFVPHGRFAEDDLFFEAMPYAFTWGWPFGYRGKTEVDPSPLLQPVSTWSMAWAAPAWYLAHYMPHTCGAQVGTALAFRLLGLNGMGVAHRGMLEQWMAGPSPEVRAQLAAHHPDLGTIAWGTDYSENSVGFCREAWKAYYPTA